MKGDIKGWGNQRSRHTKGCYQRCGKLVLTAQCETDAMLLAMLAQSMFPVGEAENRETNPRLSLWRHLRRQSENKKDFPKL